MKLVIKRDVSINRPRRRLYTNIQNVASLIKIMSICNKQHFGNIWGSINSKGKTEGELKKGVAYRKEGFR